MDSKIQIKQEVLSEEGLQNETESPPIDTEMKINNYASIWYDGCKMGIKTDIKEESPVLDSFSHDVKPLMKIKTETVTCSNYMEMDTKGSLAIDLYSENERRLFPKDLTKKINNSNDFEVEIKEDPWWLERTSAVAPSDDEKIKNEANCSELPRLYSSSAITRDALVTNFKLGQNSSQFKQTSNYDNDIRETFSVGESVYLERSEQCNDNEKVGVDLTQRNHSCGYNVDMNNSMLFSTDKCEDLYKLTPEQHGSAISHQTSGESLAKSVLKDEKPHACEICGKSFTRISNLSQHKLIHKGIRPNKCEICGKSFTQVSNLKRHKLIHDGIKQYKCEICAKIFTQLTTLKQHVLIHDGIRPNICGICGKSFLHMSTLKQHVLIHSGVRPYKCEVCGKTFAQVANLRRHNLVHSGIKQHKCEICEKTFKHLSALKEHYPSHSGVKPHKCDKCDKGFAVLSSLKQHKLTHDAIKRHKCQVCEKRFTSLSHLKSHNLIHAGVKPHKCMICDKSFRRLSGLKRHKLIHYKN